MTVFSWHPLPADWITTFPDSKMHYKTREIKKIDMKRKQILKSVSVSEIKLQESCLFAFVTTGHHAYYYNNY